MNEEPPPPADGSESHPYRGSSADVPPRVAPLGRDGCPQPSAGGGGGTDAQPPANQPLHRRHPLKYPKRKTLPHDVPWWLREDTVFFITINCEPRGKNHLARPEVARSVFAAAKHYHDAGRWFVETMLLMPDHLHTLIAFPNSEALEKVIAVWKRYLARTAGISWQRGFFDHRLRTHESREEKAEYIALNPVRKGLVVRPEEWEFVWENPGLWE